MKTISIYALCEPGTRTVRYIGMTGTSLKERLQAHLWGSIKLASPLGEWLRGLSAREEKPELIELRRVPVSQRLDAERRFIRLALGMGMNLVNNNRGGGGPPFHSVESRAKISVATAGEKNPMFGRRGKDAPGFGRPGPMLGKSHPEETKSKISASLMGRHNSPETCLKKSKPKSEQTKKNMKIAQLLRRAKERGEI